MTTETKTATATFTWFKVTKGTQVYREDGDDPKIGTIYVRKSTLGAVAPKQLTVVLEWQEEL